MDGANCPLKLRLSHEETSPYTMDGQTKFSLRSFALLRKHQKDILENILKAK